MSHYFHFLFFDQARWPAPISKSYFGEGFGFRLLVPEWSPVPSAAPRRVSVETGAAAAVRDGRLDARGHHQ